jgi:hypothetical protein
MKPPYAVSGGRPWRPRMSDMGNLVSRGNTYDGGLSGARFEVPRRNGKSRNHGRETEAPAEPDPDGSVYNQFPVFAIPARLCSKEEGVMKARSAGKADEESLCALLHAENISECFLLSAVAAGPRQNPGRLENLSCRSANAAEPSIASGC